MNKAFSVGFLAHSNKFVPASNYIMLSFMTSQVCFSIQKIFADKCHPVSPYFFLLESSSIL